MSDRDILILDGATGTELHRRGVDTSLPLWSARALIGDADALYAVHADYLDAGADAITTNTFRTHRRSLARAGLGHRAEELTRLAVDVARRARDDRKPKALVLGSVAPLEDCYRPDLAPDEDSCSKEQEEIIHSLVESGVDLVLIETMNTVREACAAAAAAERLAPGRWILSCCCRFEGPPGTLLSGESMADLLRALDQRLPAGASAASAIGINCVAATDMERQVRSLRSILPANLDLIAYANVGRPDDQYGWVNTDAVDPARYAALASRWIEAGATMVGGCCGTTPATIRALAQAAAQKESRPGEPGHSRRTEGVRGRGHVL